MPRNVPDEASFLRQPLKQAALVALIYAGLAGLYIAFSGDAASRIAATVGQLERIELIKGMMFVLVTSALLFVGSFEAFRRLTHQGMELLKHREMLMATERSVVSSAFTCALAHDFNNALQISSGNMSLLKYALPQPDQRQQELIAGVDAALSRMIRLVEQMRAAGHRKVKYHREQFDLHDALSKCVALVRRHKRVNGHTVTMREGQGISVNAFLALIEDSVINMVLNAAEAMEQPGRIEIVLSREDGHAVIEIHDSGPGVTPDAQEHIFEPYFTTKETGTGLGMLSVRTCAEMHEGSISVAQSHLGGACFRLHLPEVLVPEQSSAA